jgi:hypothetical protein
MGHHMAGEAIIIIKLDAMVAIQTSCSNINTIIVTTIM